MDEDDGMMLNFAVPDNTVNTKRAVSKVTGGSWKDRRKLQLSLQGRGRNEKKAVTGVNDSLITNSKIDQIRETRIDSKVPRGKSSTPSHGPSTKRIKFDESGGQFGGKNNSYVSSLFTSNEGSSQLAETSQADQKTYLPSNAPLKDATSFDGLGLNDKLAKHLTEGLRFSNPTKVQRAVIPNILMNQKDLFVKAQTGSGKTLAFLLPIFHKLMMENTNKIGRDSGLFAIILTPTRELATQIYGVMETLTRCYHHIVPGIVIGGEKKKSEKARLRKGVNILVATPGRLADHIENTETLNISQLRWLILDEGDKLVELGFEETITQITEKITRSSQIMETMSKWQGLPNKRVNILCSATIQASVKKLGSIILNNPEMVNVDEVEGTTSFDDESKQMSAPDQLIQNIVVVPPKLRLVTMSAILRKISKDVNATEAISRSIVFFSCSDSVNFHFDVFTRDGKRFKKVKHPDGTIEEKLVYYNKDIDENDVNDDLGFLTAPLIGENTAVFKLHGSLSQQTRASTLQSFIKSKSKLSILLCTDVASRGLDMPDISNVIEYDPPFTIEDHLHRIGRSARVGKQGKATLFLLPGIEEGYVDGKIKVVHNSNLRVVKYENLLKDGFAEDESSDAPVADKKTKVDPKKKDGKWDIHATTWHLDVERWLLEDSSIHSKAVQAFVSHIRAYTTHLSSERSFFNVKLLHLGHLAKSFGLRETPKKLGKSVGSNNPHTQDGGSKSKKEDPRKKLLRMAKLAVNANSSEFNY
jgi:ATP-dependent RNA helicase DDX31/DBP7